MTDQGPSTSAPGAALDPAAALEALQQHEAWAVIRLRDSATVTLVGGSRSEVERLVARNATGSAIRYVPAK